MRPARLLALGVALALALALLAGCGSSSSKKSSTKTTSGGGGGVSVTTAAAAGTTIDVTVSDTKGLDGPMTLTASPATASAGDITFKVTNKGTIDHEVLLIGPGIDAFDKIPIADAGDPPAAVATGANKIDEAKNVGETGDPNLKPGDSRSFTVKKVAAGSYALVCNIAQHYGLGMRAMFTVS